MAIKLIKFVLVVLVVNSGFISALPPIERVEIPLHVNIEERIEEDGFPVEVHHVVTSDGYILKMHRIPRGRGQAGPDDEPRIPVFLMHGLTASSYSYVSIGPELSIGYNLADAGFDVWMGNARGNRESRAHVSLNPDGILQRFAFFDFTWEEIGMIDVPTMIDYVLDVTGYQKLHYIGHSQGGTVFLVLNSMRPEYNDKFLSANLLAGVGYQKHFHDIILANTARLTNTIYTVAKGIGLVELFPDILPADIDVPDWFPLPTSAAECFTTNIVIKPICGVMGLAGDVVTSMQSFGGASVKQFAHYGQNIQDKLFRRWDFGIIGNLKEYKRPQPPRFDLSLITVNVTMHWAPSDDLLDEKDVLAMASDMANTVTRRVAKDSFTHTDFTNSNDTKELVTNYIIDAFESMSNE